MVHFESDCCGLSQKWETQDQEEVKRSQVQLAFLLHADTTREAHH